MNTTSIPKVEQLELLIHFVPRYFGYMREAERRLRHAWEVSGN